MSIGSGAGPVFGSAATGAASAIGSLMNPLSLLSTIPGLSSSSSAMSGGVGPITFGAFNAATGQGSSISAPGAGENVGTDWVTMAAIIAAGLVAVIVIKRIK